jgi:hypothetical protein
VSFLVQVRGDTAFATLETDAMQGRHMLSISRPMKLPNTPSVAMKEARKSTIHLQQVCCVHTKSSNLR